MTERSWNTVFGGVQAGCAVILVVLGVWAFFFSSLSQKVEESLRTEIMAAKQELIDVRQAKADVEGEKRRLVVATEELRSGRDRLAAELATLADQIADLRKERAAYAGTTSKIANQRYVAQAQYELAEIRKIAEICSNYDQHTSWISSVREFAKLEAQWSKLPFEKQYDDRLPINKRRNALQELSYQAPRIWFNMPHKPDLQPVSNPVVFTAHFVRLLNFSGENYEELNTYLVGWLRAYIVKDADDRVITGSRFVEQTKKYPFLSSLLPRERSELETIVQKFIGENPDLQNVQLNATTSRNPSSTEIIAAGKKSLPVITDFERRFLIYLQTAGISEKS